MSYSAELTTAITKNEYCPVEGLAEVGRGEKTATGVENKLKISYDLRSYCQGLSFLLERIYQEASADPRTEGWKIRWEVGRWLTAYFLFWSRAPGYFSEDKLRAKVWYSSKDLIDFLAGYREDPRYKSHIDKILKYQADAEKRAMQVIVVAYVAEPTEDPDEEGYTELTEEQIKALPQSALFTIVMGRFQRPPETTTYEVEVPVTRPYEWVGKRIECKIEMSYGCLKNMAMGTVDRLPSLAVKIELPTKDCGKLKKFYIQIDKPVSYEKLYEVLGGDIAAKQLVILKGKKYKLTYRESLGACPMPGKTNAFLGCYDNWNRYICSDVKTVWSSQFKVAKVAQKQNWDSKERKLILDTGEEVMPSDWYDYQIGDTVIVFAPGSKLDLPLTSESKPPETGRVIPVRMGDCGV